MALLCTRGILSLRLWVALCIFSQIAPYLCALLLRLNGQVLHALQWVCVIVQCCAIAIVQYDACKGTGFLPVRPTTML